ncbi:hypothetical protein F5883DRAFT_531837 [Diaporthe sp. PMI_573]|nr:hypothetical protein F5883DRAFT_531837 [Diaporthaceae sp. PMI_573]
MPDPRLSAPTPDYRKTTVDFIDNRLPKRHPAFVNPPVRFDPMSGHYVSKDQALVQRPADGAVVVSGGSNALLDDDGIPPRPEWTNVCAMNFWNRIFPKAMDQLRSTPQPKGRAATIFDIRNKQDWETIYDTLEQARNKYQSKGGPVGWLRKVRREGADNLAPVGVLVKTASKMAPSDPYATPILGAVEILLDAVKTAARVREQVLEGFDGLVPIFSDVELFLGTFQGDLNIEKASVDLTVTTLAAIERAIGFFVSNEFFRGGKAFFQGSGYENDLIKNLDSVKEKSRALMEEAAKSHIHEFHLYSRETRRFQEYFLQTMGDGFNSIEALLREYIEKQKEENREQNRKLEAALQENTHLRVENGILRATSPFQQMVFPPSHTQAPVMEWYISQDVLRQILDISDVDLMDVVYVADKKTQFPPKQRVLTEQIVNTQLFRNWLVSPCSTKLLVQWDSRLPKTIAGVTPLSLFCANIIQALRSKEQFLSALWFCGQHVDKGRAGARIGGRAMLASLIDQLLRQHTFDMRALHQDVDPDGLQGGDIKALINMLAWLARQLPQTTTLFFIIDGVVLFEREEFESEALPVFANLLGLTADRSLCANIKVLFTSTPGTGIVRAAFEAEDLLLNMHTLPQLTCPPNDERLDREFGRELTA